MADHQKKQLLTLRLHEVGAVKFGRFTLKSGVQSPVYVDLRVMVSHPTVMVRGRVGGAWRRMSTRDSHIDVASVEAFATGIEMESSNQRSF